MALYCLDIVRLVDVAEEVTCLYGKEKSLSRGLQLP